MIRKGNAGVLGDLIDEEIHIRKLIIMAEVLTTSYYQTD